MNRDPEFWKKPAVIQAPMATWLPVHGNLCLALRHPENRGPSRESVVDFVKNLGRFLVESGALTEDELKAAEKLEAEEGSVKLSVV